MDYPPSLPAVLSGVGATTSLPAAVERTASTGGGVGERRRPGRKPVPVYKPGTPVGEVGKGGEVEGEGERREVVHKSSFGDGRAMHYLIPDILPLTGGKA